MPSDATSSRSGQADAESGPRNNVERQIYNIWAEVLERSDFGIFDNFFSLGGKSLDVINVLESIERDFGRTLSLGSFFRAPTIAATYTLLRVPMEEEGSWRSLVPIRAAGGKPPLFCVHPLGGSTIRFFELARALPADQPVYGLQSPGLVDVDWAPDSMRDIAQTCFEEIQQLSAGLPIQLIGYSFGGLLAFEIAQLVTRNTGHCPLVAMIDVPTDAIGGGDEVSSEQAAINYLASTFHIEPDKVSAAGDREAAVQQIYGQVVENIISGPDLPLLKWRILLNVLDRNFAAMHSYKLEPYPGDVVVFSNKKGEAKSDLGWSSYARRVMTYPLGAAHENALEGEGVRYLAAALTPLLAANDEKRS